MRYSGHHCPQPVPVFWGNSVRHPGPNSFGTEFGPEFGRGRIRPNSEPQPCALDGEPEPTGGAAQQYRYTRRLEMITALYWTTRIYLTTRHNILRQSTSPQHGDGCCFGWTSTYEAYGAHERPEPRELPGVFPCRIFTVFQRSAMGFGLVAPVYASAACLHACMHACPVDSGVLKLGVN